VIYLIQAEESKRVKIGFTRGLAPVEHRLSSLQVGSPEMLHILCCFEGTHEEEQSLHTQFAPYRMHGEWFRCEGGLQRFIDKQEGKRLTFEDEPDEDYYVNNSGRKEYQHNQYLKRKARTALSTQEATQ
jgi:hypothetical protein